MPKHHVVQPGTHGLQMWFEVRAALLEIIDFCRPGTTQAEGHELQVMPKAPHRHGTENHVVQFDTWSSSISIDDLLDVTEMAVKEMALIVHGSDPPVAWVAPHLRRGAPRHYALAGARTSAIWSALIDLLGHPSSSFLLPTS